MKPAYTDTSELETALFLMRIAKVTIWSPTRGKLKRFPKEFKRLLREDGLLAFGYSFVSRRGSFGPPFGVN